MCTRRIHPHLKPTFLQFKLKFKKKKRMNNSNLHLNRAADLNIYARVRLYCCIVYTYILAIFILLFYIIMKN